MKSFLQRQSALLIIIFLLIAAISLGLFLSYRQNAPKYPFQNYTVAEIESIAIEYISVMKSYKGTLSAEEINSILPLLQDITVYQKAQKELYDYNGGYELVVQITTLEKETTELRLFRLSKDLRLYINDILYRSDTAPKTALHDRLLDIVQAHADP